MAITTRAELRTAITAKIVRQDKTAFYDEYILNGEGELNARLRLLQQMVSTPTTVSLAQGGTTATLPTNYLEPVALIFNDTKQGLQPRTYEQIAYAQIDAAGRPENFAFARDFVFDRPADQAYTLKSWHFEKWALGAGDSATNWLLLNDPFAYLYAALAAFAEDARDPKNPVSLWAARRDQRIDRLNKIDARSRKSAPLVMDPALTAGRGRYDITRG